MTEKQFRNVSIITTLNSQKDEINKLRSERFAAETKQYLTHFYSINSILSNSSEENGEKCKAFTGHKCSVKGAKISDCIQEALWEQPTCANTKLIPGKLSICQL